MGDKAGDGWEASLTTRRPNATDGKTGKKQKKLAGNTAARARAARGSLTEPKRRRGERRRAGGRAHTARRQRDNDE